MIVSRTVIAVLPQLLLLLLAGGRLDLLGGWSHTDAAAGILMTLFVLAPLATATLLVVEILRYRAHARQESARSAFRSFQMGAVAVFVFLESLAADLLILSQLRMH